MTNIQNMNLTELEDFILSLGDAKFRAKQIYSWLSKGASYEDMSNIPKSLKQKLQAQSPLYHIKAKKVQISVDGTRKYLFELADGYTVESVFMTYEHGTTVCVSSQVGCKMGCVFCATGSHGFIRNLEPYEMIEQLIQISLDTNKRIDGFVIMGMGEPLDNYDNIIKFLHLASDPLYLGIGMRHISLSTCGIVPKIYELAKEKMQLTLSVSLHCPENERRSELMPINKAYPLPELIKACKSYVKQTGRRISFEYALIHKKSDSFDDADKLIKLLSGLLCHVNLIMLNEVEGKSFTSADKKSAYAFCKRLCDGGINATIRRRLGADIDAACGQLYEKSKNLKEQVNDKK